jgi:hypothetical protein
MKKWSAGIVDYSNKTFKAVLLSLGAAVKGPI